MDVSSWLRDLGLEHYAQAFQANDIDAEVLSRLTADDLTALGITSVGHRHRLLDAVAVLQGGTAPASAQPTGFTIRPGQAERRQLTVLFCDLVGSTELAARLDPEDLRGVMGAYHSCTAAVVERFEGHVAKYLGDGMLAYFGWPQAHEDDAERAVRAGLELVAAVTRLEPHTGVRLQARVGIATGQVVAGDLVGAGATRDEAVVGHTPNLAARLQAAAHPGTVVISEATRRLVGGLFELADLGPLNIKGFAAPLSAWRVEGEGRAEGRFDALHGEHLTPLVGREEEIALLLRRWRQAQDGEGQVVLLVGEAGIGKSRIVREVTARLEHEPCIRLLYQCSPQHATSPLYPLIRQLERAAGFARGDPPEAKVSKLETLLARGSNRLDHAVPLIAALLGLPTAGRYTAPDLNPGRQKRLSLEALTDQLAAIAARQPVLALYEDVHWIDPSTLELLGMIIEHIRQRPVLALITFRPEFQPPWTGQAHVTTLTMSRLGRGQGAGLVAGVTGDKPLPAEVVEQIVARTDGVPLFVEELTKAVLESGRLKDAGDHYELTGPLPPLAIPATLQDSLVARLDRLGPVKEIAQIGAVIGHEFSYALLAELADEPEADLHAALDQLVASELVFRSGTPPEAAYSFKHALVHDAAYATLLTSRRQQLHIRIVDVSERQPSEIAASQPELLAYHCTQAGLIEKAVSYWYRAGRQAMARPTVVEAAALLTKALHLLPSLESDTQRDREESDLLIPLGAALIATKGLAAPEVERVMMRARELHPGEDPNPQILSALYSDLFVHHLDRSSNEVARQIAEKLLRLAVEQKNHEMEFIGHYCVAVSLFSNGQFAPALEHFKQSLAKRASLASPARPDIRVACLLFKALILLVQGYPDKALEARVEGRAAAQGLRPDLRRQASYLTGWFHQLCREHQLIEERARALIELVKEHGQSAWEANDAVLQGSAVGLGQTAESGIDELLKRLEAIKYIDVQQHTPGFLGLLAELYIDIENFDEALKLLEEALARVGRLEEHWFKAELHRVRGEVMQRSPDPERRGAEECFRKAIAVAKGQQAKLWELRAASSLARLWATQGRRAEAYDLLAPVYGWFTEGFDTADLKDAKALLDELARGTSARG